MSVNDAPFHALEKIFHEPSRLAIMSALCSTERGLTFTELKKECDLTDGNLNRHLNVLKEHKAVKAKKAFVDDKPRTTVFITPTGLARFNEYLTALASVIKQAQAAVQPSKKKADVLPLGKRAVI